MIIKADPKVIQYLEKIGRDKLPENKRGILAASSCAFNTYSRPPVILPEGLNDLINDNDEL